MGNGFVMDSLFSAMHALVRGSDVKGVIRRSILPGNDTDTTAAVAGGLAGARYGIGGLPDGWMALLRGQEIIEAIVGRAARPS